MAPLKQMVVDTAITMTDLLTMSEKTWLHWSVTGAIDWIGNAWAYHVWKDMAPLKHSSTMSGISCCPIALPCLKRHGSIEAHLFPIIFLDPGATLTMSEKTWLHWSQQSMLVTCLHFVILPCLKRHGSIEAPGCSRTPAARFGPLPCLKRHGSIEADHAFWSYLHPIILPCLKRHGSIEAARGRRRWCLPSPLPCLKRHGSIEATTSDGRPQNTGALTMSEKTWLHWSITNKLTHNVI